MENYAITMVVVSFLGGVLLYVVYKRHYERRIQEALHKNIDKKPIIALPTVMLIYMVGCLVSLLILSNLEKEPASIKCNINGTVAFALEDEKEVKRYLYDDMNLNENNMEYTLNKKRVDDHLTIIYATNQTSYVYVLKYEIGRELQKNESFVSELAQGSTIISDIPEKGVFYSMIKGKFDENCEEIIYNFHIYNFCDGTNSYPVDIKKAVTVKNGGVYG